MIQATTMDKAVVIQILSESFNDNKSVNYILRQDAHCALRLGRLMEYSFLTCLDFGKVLLSEDGKCCALVLFPDLTRTTTQSIWRDLKLILNAKGIGSVAKVRFD